jgi:hypothetical protein
VRKFERKNRKTPGKFVTAPWMNENCICSPVAVFAKIDEKAAAAVSVDVTQ